jgi:hypothetical protein
LARVPKKVHLKSIATCARSMGVHIPCTTLVIVVGSKDIKEKFNFRAAKKVGKKGNPINQNTQLTNKIKKLEKVLKKFCKKGQKRHYNGSDSNSE